MKGYSAQPLGMTCWVTIETEPYLLPGFPQWGHCVTVRWADDGTEHLRLCSLMVEARIVL